MLEVMLVLSGEKGVEFCALSGVWEEVWEEVDMTRGVGMVDDVEGDADLERV